MEKVTLKINNIEITVPADYTILQAARVLILIFLHFVTSKA